MKFLYILIILAALFHSCKENPNAVVEALEVEVIAIHDEVMPETVTIQKLKRQLEKMEATSADSLVILSLMKKLDRADDSMMNWMQQYKIIDFKKYTSTNMEYLRDQMVRIIKVKEKMILAIKESNQYLEN